jgi:hypothetical protein
MKLPKVTVGQVWYDEVLKELVVIKRIYAEDVVSYDILTSPRGTLISIRAEYKFFDPDQTLEFKFITDELTEQKLLELKLRYGF